MRPRFTVSTCNLPYRGNLAFCSLHCPLKCLLYYVAIWGRSEPANYFRCWSQKWTLHFWMPPSHHFWLPSSHHFWLPSSHHFWLPSSHHFWLPSSHHFWMPSSHHFWMPPSLHFWMLSMVCTASRGPPSARVHTLRAYTPFKRTHLPSVQTLWVYTPFKCTHLLSVHTLWVYIPSKRTHPPTRIRN